MILFGLSGYSMVLKLFHCLLIYFVCICRVAAGEETPEKWFLEGQAAVNAAKQERDNRGKAKNIILFVGDGMGISSITAGRILEGQKRGEAGEENSLSFERFPHVALLKTYNTNQQTPDSAGTMTAMMTGVKTKAGLIAVNQYAKRSNCDSASGNKLQTFLEKAEIAGKSTGVVTTARITHATPAATYAHSPERNWEDDHKIPKEEQAKGCKDIARQLLEFPFGDGLEVALGGGRDSFLPNTMKDPESPDLQGWRADGRDLTQEWLGKFNRAAYVWNINQFNAIKAEETDHLLGLFSHSHMAYENDRTATQSDEPSLTQMTAKSLAILSKNEKGYFLMVEAGRIDHGHHAGNALRALTDVIELSNAVRFAAEHTDPQKTLIVVTSDHSNVFTIGGYPTRGNNILGKVVSNDAQGDPDSAFSVDVEGHPYTALGYANGPGYVGGHRPDLSAVDTSNADYLPEAAVPLALETHSAEDVAVFARGPGAFLLQGVQEQNFIFHLMNEVMQW